MRPRTISSYMTPEAKTIKSGEPLSVAERLMTQLGVRHLPVVKHGKVCGILSAREIEIVAAFVEGETDQIEVDRVMVGDPFLVSPDAPLNEVAVVMAEKRYGAAIVTDEGRVVGMFTTVDALKALADFAGTGQTDA